MKRQNILLVDDSEDDRFLMRTAFKMAKCKVSLQEVGTGDEAIAYLKGESSYDDRNTFPLPTVMLLDLNMPRKDGFEVLGWVRGQPGLKRLSIIVLTASMRRQDVERAFDLGATSFLVKPSNLDDLAIMLGHLCDWMQIAQFATLQEADG